MKASAFALFAAVLLALSAATYALRISRNHPHRGALNDGLFWRRANKHLPLRTNAGPAPAQWFTQQAVDHFDPQNTQTWSQRYFVNATFWQPGQPIFIMLGGEGPVSADVVGGHFIINEYAEKFGALIVGVEHRFYGASIPTADLSTKNLALLTSEQALADYAVFVQYIKEKYNSPDSKVIAFGGSYSGSLAAWFRLKYPHLVDGSIATSAPVDAEVDFPQYNDVVTQSILYFAGQPCVDRIANVTATVTQMLTTPQGRQQVEQIFQTCSPIVSDDDVALFFDNIQGGIDEIIQYNNDNNQYTPMNAVKMCEIIMEGDDPLTAYANFNAIFNAFSGSNCTQVSYNDYIAQMKDTTPFPQNENAAGRTWTYQTCTEFGWYQTGEGNQQPFSTAVTLDWFLKQCTDIFGLPTPSPSFPNVAWTNTNYGSTNLQSTKIVLPNGSIDPWHTWGVLKPQNPGLSTVFITGTAHCADLYPPRDSDVAELTAARQLEVQLIAQWLADD